MRKLGIVIALVAAATLGSFGFAGTASAQEEVQGPLCDQVIGGVAGATVDTPINDTTAGAQDSCNQSFEESKVVADPLLCGVEKDVTELVEPLGAVPAGVHGGLDDLEDTLEGGGFPDIVDFDHPCNVVVDSTSTNGGGSAPNGPSAQVQAANATADGGLPRTGAELFAGAGFALMSLGALVRRFLP